jgi:hypothetical protein
MPIGALDSSHEVKLSVRLCEEPGGGARYRDVLLDAPAIDRPGRFVFFDVAGLGFR